MFFLTACITTTAGVVGSSNAAQKEEEIEKKAVLGVGVDQKKGHVCRALRTERSDTDDGGSSG